jgi:RNA polymerase sigma-70 factor (ECF subfamily)
LEIDMSEPQAQVPVERSEESDAALMAVVRAGDRGAFTRLVERHKDAVVNYLTRLTGDRDRAEDLAQESFLRLFRAAGSISAGPTSGYQEQGFLRAYLFRIATNLVRSEERREKRFRLIFPFLGGRRHDEPSAPSGMLLQELHRQVAVAVASLPLRFRVPLVLHEIEGWSYTDIAQELSCREGTVKSRIHRGRQHLRQRLEPYWNGGTAWKTSI